MECVATKTCSKCGEVKDRLLEFYTRGGACRDCVKDRQLTIYHADPTRVLANHKAASARRATKPAAPDDGLKTCSRCKYRKPRDQFCKDKCLPDGLKYVCKGCDKEFRDRPESKALQRKWRSSNKERCKEIGRKNALKTQFGITPEQYAEILSRQGGGCATCDRAPIPGKRLHVDHCHVLCPDFKTATEAERRASVRGLLCGPCNFAAGLLRDSSEITRRLADYFDDFDHRHKEQAECN